VADEIASGLIVVGQRPAVAVRAAVESRGGRWAWRRSSLIIFNASANSNRRSASPTGLGRRDVWESCSRLAVTPVQMGLRYRTALDQRMPVALDLPADLGRRGGHDDSEGIALPIFGLEIVPVSLTVNPNSSGVFRDWKICSGPQSHTTYPHTSRAQPRLPLARRSLFGKVPEIGWRHFNT
jgi:hypothetical protein